MKFILLFLFLLPIVFGSCDSTDIFISKSNEVRQTELIRSFSVGSYDFEIVETRIYDESSNSLLKSHRDTTLVNLCDFIEDCDLSDYIEDYHDDYNHARY